MYIYFGLCVWCVCGVCVLYVSVSGVYKLYVCLCLCVVFDLFMCGFLLCIYGVCVCVVCVLFVFIVCVYGAFVCVW